MSKLYRIGLDIGIGSVGYSVLENDPLTEDPCRILKLGVRTFNPNEVSDTGESTAKKRREARGVRRRARRKKFRRERVIHLFNKTFETDILSELEKIKNVDVYELRYKALDEKLSATELAKVVLNILKRRGFKSNRKGLASEEEGLLLKAIKSNLEFLKNNGYRTIGEAIYKDEKKFKEKSCGKIIYNIRNHSGDYRNCFHRDDLKNELNLILNTQKLLGNEKITDEFINNIIYVFEKQRNFDEGPGKGSPYSAKFEVGNCTFLNQYKRAPKDSYTFELFSALSKINSLKIEGETLSFEQKQKIYEYSLEKESVSFAQIRKLLNIRDLQTFNLCRYSTKKKKTNEQISEEDLISSSEKSTFVSMKKSYAIKKALGIESMSENKDILNEVALMLCLCKSDKTIDDYILENEILKNLSEEQIENIKKLNCDKFGSLSIQAMEMIIPYLFDGERYDNACKLAGFNHSSFGEEKQKYLKGEKVEERLKDITSNVVRRAVNQTLRIVNEIIKEYDCSPQFISIELSRELSKDKSERNKLAKKQEENMKKNENIVSILTNDYHIVKPTGLDILKYKLYQEQNAKCMYSGKPIDINMLFEPNFVQVDHIIPFSRSMDDSFNNKVLVLSSENQNKGDRTPFEFFGNDETKWADFVSRENLLNNRAKKKLLLKEKFSEEERTEFIERNLNDTRYMSKFLYNLFKDLLQMTPSKKYKKVVRSVNGAVTSYLRRFWGIDKIREDGDIHHSIDATIIATVSEGQINKITDFNKYKEKYIPHEGKYISRKTGEVISEEEKLEIEQSGIDFMSKKLPTPYPWFLRELELRSKVFYTGFKYSEEEMLEFMKMGYELKEIEKLKPVFVSRMKTVKMTGRIHKDTMMSLREYDETKNLIKTVHISKLKLSNKAETKVLKDDKYPEKSIDNYYRPEDDRLLYLKLKEYLVENGSIPENMVFHKPRKDGTDGPIVKTVKTYFKSSNCVKTPNGGAENGSMHRVDVFEKDGKFYLCPVYMSDVYAKKLPNKVIAIGKDWITLDKTFNFKFSLYQNDLIKIKSKKEIEMKKNFKNEKSKKADSISSNEILAYYNGTNISTAAIDIKSHDSCYIREGLGVKTLLSIEKYYVDIMGNVYKAPEEKRKGF